MGHVIEVNNSRYNLRLAISSSNFIVSCHLFNIAARNVDPSLPRAQFQLTMLSLPVMMYVVIGRPSENYLLPSTYMFHVNSLLNYITDNELSKAVGPMLNTQILQMTNGNVSCISFILNVECDKVKILILRTKKTKCRFKIVMRKKALIYRTVSPQLNSNITI